MIEGQFLLDDIFQRALFKLDFDTARTGAPASKQSISSPAQPTGLHLQEPIQRGLLCPDSEAEPRRRRSAGVPPLQNTTVLS